MTLHISTTRRELAFRFTARTSRGVYRRHLVRYVLVRDADQPERFGVGECAPLPGLSCDDCPDYDAVLAAQCRQLATTGALDAPSLRVLPSMRFGLETALRQLERGGWDLWETPFGRGEQGIVINGLVWMDDADAMRTQIDAKLAQGFSCLKLKIGALDFAEEIALIAALRQRYAASDLTVRVDANGAFTPAEALPKLQRLADLGVHSIEQPIRAGQWEALARLVERSPLPIALDEELIGIFAIEEKRTLLTQVRPHYLVLKPTLHGGFSGIEEWSALAKEQGIGWWATSALESNIGLNAIAHWCAAHADAMPQGLGTGGLYENNIDMPLAIQGEKLWFDPAGKLPDADLFMQELE